MSIQIKGRQTGDDLIYEAIKNTRTWETGRDYKCEADLYLYANTTGKGGLYWMKHIKPEVYALVEQAKKDLDSNPCKMRWDGDGYEMKVITDHRHGNEKLMIFFYPNHFSHVPFTHLYD